MEEGEDDAESPEHVIYNEGMYVRVYAHIRSFQVSRFAKSFCLR